MDRIILHCDCNSFFASVEEMMNPELKKVPMAVAGDPKNRHGIILAKNELAKKYNIQTAEAIWQAKSKCKDLVCVEPHMKKYGDVSRKINQIYLDYTDLVEPFSIDESFLDVTNSIHLFGVSPKELADLIRERVQKEIGITISVGVSFCKSLAKLGSDYKKPNATTVFDRSNLKTVVWELPVSELLFVGKKANDFFKRYGVLTIGDLAKADIKFIENGLGKQGAMLWNCANGNDTEEVRSFFEPREVKSIGNSITFRRDLTDKEEIRCAFNALADSVCERLRAAEKKCCCIKIVIKDSRFSVIARQVTLKNPTYLQKEVAKTAIKLFNDNYKSALPIRLLGITASELIKANEATMQIDLFGNSEENYEKQEKIEDTMSAIRKKFGGSSIGFGYYENDEIGIKKINKKFE